MECLGRGKGLVLSSGETRTPSFSSVTPLFYPLASFVQTGGLGADPSFWTWVSVLSAPCLHDGTHTACPSSLTYQREKGGITQQTCCRLRFAIEKDGGTKVAGSVRWEMPLPPAQKQGAGGGSHCCPPKLAPPVSPVPVATFPPKRQNVSI